MKKRFTLMMMVLCFLMSIPLEMMAKTVTISYIDDESWGEIWAYVYSDGGQIGPNWGGTQCKTITTNADGQRVAKWTFNLDDNLAKAYVVFNNGNGNGKQYPAEGVKWIIEDGASYNKNGKITSSGSGSGSGSGGDSGSTTIAWNTVDTNRLKGRVYSQGFYLAGSFFTFSGVKGVEGVKDDRDKVTYDDAVFKFQQQNDVTIKSGNDNVVYEEYKVEIPASLTAHAQVMYVDAFGNIKNIFGPGTYSISRTCPNTDMSTEWLEAKANTCTPITQENSNYWNFKSRNVSSDDYSDGMYNLYIAVDAKTHTVKKWMIEHDSDKRVAYFISDAPNATAMPVYDAFDLSQHSEKFSNKFYASVNFSADYNYYIISNYLKSQDYVNWTENDYETKRNSKDYVSTTNKLFLQGNGGSAYNPSENTNLFFPNEKPMPGGDLGNIIVEYNPSQGHDGLANNDKHLGFSGRIKQAEGSTKIKSVSMVGDAIPGTLKVDEITGKEVWDYTSKAADMIYDDVEQCYTTTLVTNVDECKKHFRFVGNHDPKINWFEDTDGTEPDKMAKSLLSNPDAPGHYADASDPNKVNYTKEGQFSDDKYHIIWNRSAGRWTVRLYFYTRNVDGKDVTDYYYTITANNDLVLRDFKDVKYKNEEGNRDILLTGEYRFFRTWSDHKAWKVSKDVDIFIVDKMTEGTNSVEFSLKKISGSKTANVIPADEGVILATKKDATSIEGDGKFCERPSLTSYNTLVIPMEEYTGEETIADYKDNLLHKMIEADVVPTYNETTDEYNYLFGFFRANKGMNETSFKDNQFLLGFWLSKGSGLFYSNSAYLPVKSATAAKMKLGTKYGQFEKDPNTGKSKYIPALLFDFANVGSGTTGINEVVNQSTKLNDGKYYTLSGQQVEKPTAGGIYIHNGRKFVVK